MADEIYKIQVNGTDYPIRDTTKAPLDSPALVGTPTAPTAASGTNTTQIATTAFVKSATDNMLNTSSDAQTKTGALNISTAAGNGIIMGGSNYQYYTGIQAVRKSPNDSGNVNTAGFIINGDGSSKFLHRRGDTTASEDAYFTFDGTGFNMYASGTKGSTSIPTNPTFSALQSNTRPTFKGNDLALYSDASDKAPLASPALTGTPTAPTAASGTNNTQIATTAFVQAAISSGGSVSEITFTLYADTDDTTYWNNGAQSVTVSGITSSTIGIVSVSQTATQAQYNAAAYANLRCTAQGTNSVTITAYGTVPSVDIPCVITKLG